MGRNLVKLRMLGLSLFLLIFEMLTRTKIEMLKALVGCKLLRTSLNPLAGPLKSNFGCALPMT